MRRWSAIRWARIAEAAAQLALTEYGIESGVYKCEEIEDPSRIGDNARAMAENFRNDEDGRRILNLSRYAQWYMHFPSLRPLILSRALDRQESFFSRILW